MIPDETSITLPGMNDDAVDGYTFLGWSTSPTATEPMKNGKKDDSFNPTADITLYAVWQKNGTSGDEHVRVSKTAEYVGDVTDNNTFDITLKVETESTAKQISDYLDQAVFYKASGTATAGTIAPAPSSGVSSTTKTGAANNEIKFTLKAPDGNVLATKNWFIDLSGSYLFLYTSSGQILVLAAATSNATYPLDVKATLTAEDYNALKNELVTPADMTVTDTMGSAVKWVSTTDVRCGVPSRAAPGQGLLAAAHHRPQH